MSDCRAGHTSAYGHPAGLVDRVENGAGFGTSKPQPRQHGVGGSAWDVAEAFAIPLASVAEVAFADIKVVHGGGGGFRTPEPATEEQANGAGLTGADIGPD